MENVNYKVNLYEIYTHTSTIDYITERERHILVVTLLLLCHQIHFELNHILHTMTNRKIPLDKAQTN